MSKRLRVGLLCAEGKKTDRRVFLLKGCLLLWCACVLGASLDDAAIDGDTLSASGSSEFFSRRRSNESASIPLQEYFKAHKNLPCDEEYLMASFFPRSRHKSRDLTVIVILLRAKKLNIEHDALNHTFTLRDGDRLVRPGNFKEALWQRLQQPEERRSTIQWAMELSDNGFDPSLSGVEAMLTLQKIIDHTACEGTVFQRRKLLWSRILQDKAVYNQEEYRDFPKHLKKVSAEDVSVMRQCWEFYNDYTDYIELFKRRPQERSGKKRAKATQPAATKRVCLDRVQEWPREGAESTEGEVSGVLSTSVYDDDVGIRRQNLLRYLGKKKGKFLNENKLLKKYYGRFDTKDDLMEDVVALIYDGHNIQNNHGVYRLAVEDRGVPRSGGAQEVFRLCLEDPTFRDLNAVQRTLYLYDRGYYSIPLSTVALYTAAASTVQKGGAWARMPEIVMVKDIIFKEKKVRRLYEYRESQKRLGYLRYSDMKLIRDSCELYAEGACFLQSFWDFDGQCCVKKRAPYNFIHDEVSEYFEVHKGQACSEETLKDIIECGSDHRKRNVYRTIIALRSKQEKDIRHDSLSKSFTLYPGKRQVAPGCYKKVLWADLDNERLRKKSVGDVVMHISDKGYDPIWVTVEAIIMLKKLCLSADKKNSAALQCQKEIWGTILQDECVRSTRHYKGKMSENDREMFKRCWALYKYFYNMPETDEDDIVKCYLKNNPQGVTLSELHDFFVEEAGHGTSIWNRIGHVMRQGHAGNIDFDRGKFFWKPNGQYIAPKNEGLFEDLCRVPTGYSCGRAMFYLYKQGQFNITPWEVRELLDALFVIGRREDNPLRIDLRSIWAKVCEKSLSVNDLPPHLARVIRRVQHIQKLGVLQDIKAGKSANFEAIFNKKALAVEGPEVCDQSDVGVERMEQDAFDDADFDLDKYILEDLTDCGQRDSVGLSSEGPFFDFPGGFYGEADMGESLSDLFGAESDGSLDMRHFLFETH